MERGNRKNGEGGKSSGTEEEKRRSMGRRRERLKQKEEKKRTKHPRVVTPPMGAHSSGENRAPHVQS